MPSALLARAALPASSPVHATAPAASAKASVMRVMRGARGRRFIAWAVRPPVSRGSTMGSRSNACAPHASAARPAAAPMTGVDDGQAPPRLVARERARYVARSDTAPSEEADDVHGRGAARRRGEPAVLGDGRVGGRDRDAARHLAPRALLGA